MTKILYDLHIHSALSPCADNDMTPVNIGAMSSAKGLQIIAVADHNAIANVAAAREVGEALDVIVVPAVELQTQEDVHILCLSDSKLTPRWFYKGMLDQLGLEARFYRGDAKRQLQKEIEIIRGVHGQRVEF